MSTITELAVSDVRFPTSRDLDGSDAMNPDPDYSAAYVVLRTDAGDGLEGHGLTFTIGRGNEVVVAAVDALAAAGRRPVGRGPRGRPRRLLARPRRRQPAALARPGEGRDPPGDRRRRQRGLGPGGQTGRRSRVWQLLARCRRPRLVGLVDFRYIDRRAHTGRGARAPAQRAAPAGAEREAELLRDGYPAYTTSAGWLGYDDDKVRRLCPRGARRRLDPVQDEGRRGPRGRRPPDPDHPRRDRRGADARGRRQPALGRRRRRSTGWRARRRSTRTGSRSRPAPTTSSATRRSPGPSRPIRVATGEHVHNRIMFKQLLAGRGDRRLPDRRLPARWRQRGRRGPAAGRQVRGAGLPARRRRRPVRARPAPVDVRLHRGERAGSTAG